LPQLCLSLTANTYVSTACMAGDPAAAFALLDRGANIEQRTGDGSTLLHAAVTAKSLQLVRLLLEWGVDLRGETKSHVLARDVAEQVGHADMATIIDKQTFLEASQPLTGRKTKEQRPQPTRRHSETAGLDAAAQPNTIKKTGSLAKLARRVRGKGKSGGSPGGNDAAVSGLASPRADKSSSSPASSAPSTPDRAPLAPLDDESRAVLNAAKHSLAALKDAAKKNKSLLFDAHDKHQQTTLHIAAYAGLNDIVVWLLEHKKRPADFIERQDKNGWTALHAACSAQHVEPAQTLLANGASAKAVDSQQTTPVILQLDTKKFNHHSSTILYIVALRCSICTIASCLAIVVEGWSSCRCTRCSW
jgi:ankyrin repeat protein